MTKIAKTSVFQIRIGPTQLAAFKAHCDVHDFTAADVIRRLIVRQTAQWDLAAARAVKPVSKAAVPVVTTVKNASVKLQKANAKRAAKRSK